MRKSRLRRHYPAFFISRLSLRSNLVISAIEECCPTALFSSAEKAPVGLITNASSTSKSTVCFHAQWLQWLQEKRRDRRVAAAESERRRSCLSASYMGCCTAESGLWHCNMHPLPLAPVANNGRHRPSSKVQLILLCRCVLVASVQVRSTYD